MKTGFTGSLLALLLASLTAVSVAQVTSPAEFLGVKPGSDFFLATYEQLTGYFERLAAESPRISVFDMGPTTGGRRMHYAIISSAHNMAELERYKEISQRLSFARGLDEREAIRLAKEGKVVVWIDSGIHSTETSPPMHQFHLAYDLVTGTDEKTEFIRDNVILLLVQANPDGMTMVADWYMSHLGTPYETSRPPTLYHKYAGHDNNRDFHIANLRETQNMNRAVGKEWCPELMYVQHETAPFPARIWMPPNADPVNPNTHPLVFRWKNLMGSAMGRGFEAADQPGAISRNGFDLWYPGYQAGPNVEAHNIPSVLTETANYRYATPHFYTLSDFPEAYQDLVKGTFYPSPWRGGWWHIKDAIAYNLTASKSILDLAARFKYDFLYSKYKTGTDVIEKFSHEPPYGWIITARQRDKGTTIMLLNRLIEYGIEVYKAEEDFVHNGIEYPAGSYLLPTSQAFGFYIKNLLEKQEYPDLRKYPYLWQGVGRQVTWGGAPIAPYDGVGWTLQKQLGVDAAVMSAPIEVGKALVADTLPPTGSLIGNGRHCALSVSENNSFRAINRILDSGGEVHRALERFTLDGIHYPRGSFIISSRSISREDLRVICEAYGVQARSGRVTVDSQVVSQKRIALYKGWTASMDAGWISFVLDAYSFPYHELRDAEVRAGGLGERFEVIILPDQSVGAIINGNRAGTMPPDYTGGIGREGLENIKEFVKAGGWLICNKNSCGLAVDEFALPVLNKLQGVRSDSFNCPGSLLKIVYDAGNPLTFGQGEEGVSYFSRGLVFEAKTEAEEKAVLREDWIVAKYPDEPLLLSGWILGEELLHNGAAILDVPFERGRIVLFGFSFHNRAQSYVNFKLLFNALL